jgi:DNA polymerase delta subunit 2
MLMTSISHRFLGSSGQNINDIFKYMVEQDEEARIQAACNTLDWGHLAPTAPDTLCESSSWW